MVKVLNILSCFVFLTHAVKAQDYKNIKALNHSFEKVINTNFNEAKRIALQAVLESEKVLNDTLLLESYTNLSHIYLYLELIDSSSVYCDKGVLYAKKIDDLEKLSTLYNRKGILARKQSDFKTSFQFHEKALGIAESKGLSHLEASIDNSVALLYRDREEIDKSFKALEKAIGISSLHNYKNELARSYNTKGVLFFNTQKDSVLPYYDKALKIVRNNNNMFLEGALLCNIGDFYLNIGDNNKAISYLEAAKTISTRVGDMDTFYYVNVSECIYYENIGRYDEAIKGYKKILNDYKGILNNSQRRRVYWLLSGTLWYNKQFKEAFNYQEQYIFLNDSIFNIKKEKEFESLRTQYEVEKKDNQILLLEKENELANTRRKWVFISAILLTIPLIVLFLFYRHRAKTLKTIGLQEIKLHQKEKERLKEEQKLKATEALIEGQDKERERIAKELHDGIGGQLASINLSLSHINHDINNKAIAKINGSLKNTFNELRVLSHSLSHNFHKDKSLEQLLSEFKRKYEESKLFGLDILIYPEKSLEQLDTYTKHHLYRIIQELLTNIVKHAKAEQVELSFNKYEAILIIILQDNGKGFNIEEQKNGIGISNIKERVESINGAFSIDSTINKGTSVVIEIPINKNTSHED
ncbi:tetratricopeptide repeat-containing sensor histidine kinase [Flavivirga jejuensis]|uniref:Oxygen sensor histidine kinase NreB n=1 Tax=Flavivirga jejuensis TaxID=870487 RepID=A0ABT8WKA3_9FLAO|nr:sensor histidine kinase [Flavivirga jejuensis]MDO5973591.1 sensor histidine kinase [Flavivirga jejuensis]